MCDKSIKPVSYQVGPFSSKAPYFMTTMKKFRTITACTGLKNDEKNLQQYYHKKDTCASYELLASSQRSTQQFRSFGGTCVSWHASPAGEHCCHPSLFAGIMFHDSKTPSKSENTWLSDRPSKKQCFGNFLFAQTLWWGTATTFPSAPWTSCGMARTHVSIIEHFRCLYPLNSLGDVFLFSGRNRELAKPRSAGDYCITHHDTSLPKDVIQSASLAPPQP